MMNLENEKTTALLTGMSVYWLRRKRWEGGGIPFVKFGSAVRYRREDIEVFIMARVRRSTSEAA